MVSFGDTLLAAVQGVVRVLLVVVTGAVIQTKQILPAPLRLGLSQLVFRLFLPCLLFTSVAQALSISKLASLVGVFAFAVGAHFTGAAVGWAASMLFERLAPAKYHSPVFQAPLFAACVALGNHGYLPLSLLPTVLGLLPFGSQRDADDDSAEAVAITAMYIMCLNVLSWTFIHGLIKRQKRNTMCALGLQVAMEPPKPPQALAPPSLAAAALACLRRLLNPPLIACISGVIIGLAAPLKAIIFAEIDEDAPCEEDEPSGPLQPTLTGALLSLADCTVPIVLLQLGATMTDMYTASRSRQSALSGATPRSEAQAADGGTAPAPALDQAQAGTEPAPQPAALDQAQAGTEPAPQPAAEASPPAVDNIPMDDGANSTVAEGNVAVACGEGEDTIHAPMPGSESSAVLPTTAGAADAPDSGHGVLQVDSPGSSGECLGPADSVEPASSAAASPVDVSLATVSWPLLATVLAARLVVMPALGTALVYGLVQAGVLPSDDPVLVFVVMMQFTPPPAMNLALIAELETFAQAAVGQVLFVGHITAAVSMTAWISLQLAIVNSIIDTGAG